MKSRHEKFIDRFEKDLMDKNKPLITSFGAMFVGVILLNLGLLAFGIWVIIKLMQHFGVI